MSVVEPCPGTNDLTTRIIMPKTLETAKLLPQKNYKLLPCLIVALWLMPLGTTIISQIPAKAKSMDGFFAYCTSNLDSTGECVNEEDGLKFSCLIVPGQIISCPTKTSRSMECVWISGVTANQAQFWCDRYDEAALYGSEIESSVFDSLDDTTSDNPNERNNTGSPGNSIFIDGF